MAQDLVTRREPRDLSGSQRCPGHCDAPMRLLVISFECTETLSLLTSNAGSEGPKPLRSRDLSEEGSWMVRGWSLPVPTQDQGGLEAGELAQLWGQRERDRECLSVSPSQSDPVPGPPPPRCHPAMHLLSELHGLQGQLPSGRKDERPGTGLATAGLEPLKHGDEETRRLAAASPRHGHHILAVQDHRDGLQGHGWVNEASQCMGRAVTQSQSYSYKQLFAYLQGRAAHYPQALTLLEPSSSGKARLCVSASPSSLSPEKPCMCSPNCLSSIASPGRAQGERTAKPPLRRDRR